jgi:hypothetical protein
VRCHRQLIPPALREASVDEDPQARAELARWIDALWREKDSEIDALLKPSSR